MLLATLLERGTMVTCEVKVTDFSKPTYDTTRFFCLERGRVEKLRKRKIQKENTINNTEKIVLASIIKTIQEKMFDQINLCRCFSLKY